MKSANRRQSLLNGTAVVSLLFAFVLLITPAPASAQDQTWRVDQEHSIARLSLGSGARAEALRPILVLHGFRYIGMAALIPGVVSPELSATVFARGLAYGDLAAATLAPVALAALRTRWATVLVWIFNSIGTADLLNAFYQGSRISLAAKPGVLGVAYFIPIFGVPWLLVTHILVFRLLTRRENASASRVAGHAA